MSYRLPANKAQFIHGTPTDDEILLLWQGGMDTFDISKKSLGA